MLENLMQVFSFLSNQLLKMDWLYNLIKILLEKVFKIQIDTRLGSAIHFFIYDVIKILILLIVLIFIVSYIQSFFPPEKTKKTLTKFKGIKGNIMGALLGIVTPFCSCSSIPIFIGFTTAGLPLGVTFSFLIASPLIDLASFLILTSFFGIKISLIYVGIGFILAVISGTVISKLKLEDQIQDYIKDIKDVNSIEEELTTKQRIEYSFNEVKTILKKVWIYILIGIGIGAMIHNYIPEYIIDSIIGSNNPFAVILSTVIGVPMYANIFGTIPIAEALFLKNVPIGTVLSFMMAVTALSAPSMVMISRVVKPKLLVIFISIVTFGIMLIGYLFNILQSILIV